MRRLLMIGMLLGAHTTAEIVDRVVVALDLYAITLSKVNEEIRVTAFQEQHPVDLSPASRREAANRLVEQELVRRQMRASQYPAPSKETVDELMEGERKANPDFQAALDRYGITESVLREHLEKELMLLEFVRQRFLSERDTLEAPDKAALDAKLEQSLTDWLEQTKKQTRIRWVEEALQ